VPMPAVLLAAVLVRVPQPMWQTVLPSPAMPHPGHSPLRRYRMQTGW